MRNNGLKQSREPGSYLGCEACEGWPLQQEQGLPSWIMDTDGLGTGGPWMRQSQTLPAVLPVVSAGPGVVLFSPGH